MSVNKCQHNNTEACLQLGMLIKLVQHNIRHGVTFQFNYHTHAAAVRFITQIGNAFNNAVLYKLGNSFNKACLINLVRNFSYNNAVLAFLHRLNFCARADFNNAASGIISIFNAFSTQNYCTGRKIRPFNGSHQLRNFHIRIINKHNKAINNFTQIMGRNIGCHAYRNTGAAVN